MEETGHEAARPNSYASLNGGWMNTVDAQVLGHSVAAYPPLSPAPRQTVIAAIQGGAAVTAGILPMATPCSMRYIWFPGHAYQVVRYTPIHKAPVTALSSLQIPGDFTSQSFDMVRVDGICAGIVVAETTSSVAASSGATTVSAQAARARSTSNGFRPAIRTGSGVPSGTYRPS